jgi:acetyl-CoA carboxylase beta subunit
LLISDYEIEEMLSDDSAFAEHFYTLPQVKPVKCFNDEILVKNAEEAKQNLIRSEEVEQLKKKVKDLQMINAEYRKKYNDLLNEHRLEMSVNDGLITEIWNRKRD